MKLQLLSAVLFLSFFFPHYALAKGCPDAFEQGINIGTSGKTPSLFIGLKKIYVTAIVPTLPQNINKEINETSVIHSLKCSLLANIKGNANSIQIVEVPYESYAKNPAVVKDNELLALAQIRMTSKEATPSESPIEIISIQLKLFRPDVHLPENLYEENASVLFVDEELSKNFIQSLKSITPSRFE